MTLQHSMMNCLNPKVSKGNPLTISLHSNRWIASFSLLLFASGAYAMQPRIFYTELESGPNSKGENNAGVYVNIYGKGFGAVKGSSSVSIGGGKAAAYPIWTDTQIAIQIGSAANTGSILINTPAGNSNPMPFTVRAGNIYFVSPNGKDGNNGSFGSPWQTVLKARDTMKAGDTVYAMNGLNHLVDDGQGWKTTMLLRTGGTAGNPMALVAYPGAKVTLGTVNGPNSAIRSNENSSGYWVFAGLILRGEFEAVALYAGTNWRFVNNDMSCPNGDFASACFETSVTNNVKLFGNNVHDTGKATASSLYHGVYFSTDTNNIEMGWNQISNVHGCRGIQIHSSPLQGGGPNDPTGHNQYGISIHDNLIHDTQCDGIIFATIDPSKGKIEVFNNIIYNAGKGPKNPENAGNWSCINAQSYTNTGPIGSGIVDIYNNTMFNCGTFASPPYKDSNNAISYSGPNGNVKVRLRNNIFYQSSNIPYIAINKPTGGICSNTENCGFVFGSNNLFYGTGAAPGNPNITNSINKDPLLVNLLQGDFRLQGKSPAHKAGVDTGLTVDRFGNPRGGAAGFDIGAHQFAKATVALLNCSPTVILTPGKTSCDVVLDAEAPAGGLEVALASESNSIVPQANIIIPEGGSRIAVELRATSVSSRLLTNVTASLNDVSSTSPVWLLPPGDTAPLMLSVANAASFLSDGVSPGAIITIFGWNLGPKSPSGPLVDGTPPGPLVANTRLLIDGNPAALVYVQADQITATLPNTLAGASNVLLQVEFQGQRSNPMSVPVLSTTPGIFTANASGLGQALIVNQDGTLNSPAHPAPRGSRVIFYASGLGPADALWLHIGALDTQLDVTTTRTSFPGLFQMAVQIPQQADPGDAVPMELAAGDQRSQPGVTIAII